MHMFDLPRRFMGGYGIVGGNLPIAAGFGLAADYLGTDDATVCMFGDGASNQGTFGETMNLAALWSLPVVFMVTNNRFGMGTALERHSAVTDLQVKGEGYGVPGMECDGMDVVDTFHVTTEALRIAREERRPVLVEALTYRFRGHSMADPEEYRTKDEVEEWRKRDPIVTFGDRLVAEEVITEDERAELDAAAQQAADDAVAFADASPVPGPRVALRRRLRARRAGARLVLGRRARRRRAQGRGDRRGDRLMAAMRYREALNQALREEMARDERVFLMGEDIGVFNGAFKVTDGLLEEFGERRVRDTPISENTIVGMGVGAAMIGLRPVVELMTINFSLLALDQIVNHAAHIHYMFGGQVSVPLVVRMPQGAGHQLGPTHSHSLEALFLHVPGLLVAVPSTAGRRQGPAQGGDPRRQPGRLHRARVPLRPARRGARTARTSCVPFGEAAIRREGTDVTIVGISRMAVTAEKAAELLASEHEVEAEVIDPRTLRPLDLDTILASRCGRPTAA